MVNAVFEKIVPEQKKISTRVGGLLIIVGETMFLFSLLNFLMITRLQYYSSGDTFMRRIFPDYMLFLLGMFVVAFIGMWITYVYVFPSKQRFSQEQAIKDNRSPMYNKIVEVQDELMKMRETVEKLSEKVDQMAEKK
jgi:predicted membrane protein